MREIRGRERGRKKERETERTGREAGRPAPDCCFKAVLALKREEGQGSERSRKDWTRQHAAGNIIVVEDAEDDDEDASSKSQTGGCGWGGCLCRISNLKCSLEKEVGGEKGGGGLDG